MDEPTIPQTAAFQLKLPSFEGPLDLLLHLIRKHELQILDLPIAFVTERYLEYLQLMEELDLDVASEYLLMAATLAHIKSKMLLPQTATADAFEEQDDAYQEDPRAELIRRLLEYQKYKAAAQDLGGRPMSGRDVFPRGMPAPEAQGPADLAAIDMYKLLDAFQSILKRVQGRVALEVTAERITIHERMTQLSDFLRGRRMCTFEELFEGARTRYEVVVTFLALLEMTKLRMTRIYQADPTTSLHVQFALLDEQGENPFGDAAASTFEEAAIAADAADLTFEEAAIAADAADLTFEEAAIAADAADLTAEPAASTFEEAAIAADAADLTFEEAAIAADAADLTAEPAASAFEDGAIAADAADPTFEEAAIAADVADLTAEPAASTFEDAAIAVDAAEPGLAEPDAGAADGGVEECSGLPPSAADWPTPVPEPDHQAAWEAEPEPARAHTADAHPAPESTTDQGAAAPETDEPTP